MSRRPDTQYPLASSPPYLRVCPLHPPANGENLISGFRNGRRHAILDLAVTAPPGSLFNPLPSPLLPPRGESLEEDLLTRRTNCKQGAVPR